MDDFLEEQNPCPSIYTPAEWAKIAEVERKQKFAAEVRRLTSQVGPEKAHLALLTGLIYLDHARETIILRLGQEIERGK